MTRPLAYLIFIAACALACAAFMGLAWLVHLTGEG